MKEYMKDVSVEDYINGGHTDTICLDCKRNGGGCSWSDPERFAPVKGWAAIKTDNGYIVQACPKFQRGTWACGRYRTAEDYILALEIAVHERKLQTARLKKIPDNLRKSNMSLKRKNEDLQEQLDAELWQQTVHMSD